MPRATKRGEGSKIVVSSPLDLDWRKQPKPYLCQLVAIQNACIYHGIEPPSLDRLIDAWGRGNVKAALDLTGLRWKTASQAEILVRGGILSMDLGEKRIHATFSFHWEGGFYLVNSKLHLANSRWKNRLVLLVGQMGDSPSGLPIHWEHQGVVFSRPAARA